jgi:hypothetical protein
MPRKGRIRIVGKLEAREARVREDELKDIERDLRRAWRQRRTALHDAVRDSSDQDRYDED